MIILTGKKQEKRALNQEEFTEDLSPDDLDVREENNLTKEQSQNSNQEQYSKQKE